MENQEAQAQSMGERQLREYFLNLPKNFKFKYNGDAARQLKTLLFRSMAAGQTEYEKMLFPNEFPADPSMKKSQGAEEGAEYLESARGKRCGHILKAGEASYMCRDCSLDDTCCLCSRCFHATDHKDHHVRIIISQGNMGCCDCGDVEAWKRDLCCGIHALNETADQSAPEPVPLPEPFKAAIGMTVGLVFDFICDVISCSPEQLRAPKTRETILKDEQLSRFTNPPYVDLSSSDKSVDKTLFCLIIWNDEKHTLRDVEDQISRACKKRTPEAHAHAIETDGVGRSILVYDEDIDKLLRMAKKLEEIRVTVTIRSARDTFREQMCATMVEWLQDIAGCSIGGDGSFLLHTICEQVLKPWNVGSGASHKGVSDISDEDMIADEIEQRNMLSTNLLRAFQERFGAGRFRVVAEGPDSDDDQSIEGFIDFEVPEDELEEAFDENDDDDTDMQDEEEDHGTGGPVPPPPPMTDPSEEGGDVPTILGNGDVPEPDVFAVVPTDTDTTGEVAVNNVVARVVSGEVRGRDATPSEADIVDPVITSNEPPQPVMIPTTPGLRDRVPRRAGKYWKTRPHDYNQNSKQSVADNVFEPVRLDWLILYDLRMWKDMRNRLRSLYISTIVTVPEFKHVLGRRFAAKYTVLAQLYLVGDREPDHSIISLSLQMFTTATITTDLVEKANFLTNLFAIIYTFLTTRQVSHPWEVDGDATLAFDSGSVTNRRMYHFYMDLKHLFQTPHVKKCLREEPRYLMQFLDLVKLHQGIGPNKRAMGEHVEYETDSWITASLVTREINRMAFHFTKAFRDIKPEDMHLLQHAIRITTKALILHCIGAERIRFKQAEITQETAFKDVGDFEFAPELEGKKVVQFVVETDPISFHHALHYTLSWLIECGCAMSNEELRAKLSFTFEEVSARSADESLMGTLRLQRGKFDNMSAESLLMAVYDFPIRVCAWISQIKTNMWVRNGISLRHQAGTYRGVTMRDVCYQRDLHLLQTALVTCDPSLVLATIVDRYGQTKFMEGFFELRSAGQDESQHLDVVEDMVHLIIHLLSDRLLLIPNSETHNSSELMMRRDLLHVLCLRPLTYSEILSRVSDRYPDLPQFETVLRSMTDIKDMSSTEPNVFALKPELKKEINIFHINFNRNQREDAENSYCQAMARELSKKAEEVVYQPNLLPITTGAFQKLSEVTSTGMFAQVIYYCLLYALDFKQKTPDIQQSRMDGFLSTVLHLLLIGVEEDKSTTDNESSFIFRAVSSRGRTFYSDKKDENTIVQLLKMMQQDRDHSVSHVKVQHILRRMQEKKPNLLGVVPQDNDVTEDTEKTAEEERARKKAAAAEKQARIMAQFKKQQNDFMVKQSDLDWGSDNDDEEMGDAEVEKASPMDHIWKFPSDTCLQCQEKTDDKKIFGTFALFNETRIVRTTNLQRADWVREVRDTPASLDRLYDRTKPFGIAGRRVLPHGQINSSNKAESIPIGEGFPADQTIPGPVSTSCGHLMHLDCFRTYWQSTRRRHTHQIARHHPEQISRNEFICPLCKALANTFVPIVWKPRTETYPGVLEPFSELEGFVEKEASTPFYRGDQAEQEVKRRLKQLLTNRTETFVVPLAEKSVETLSLVHATEEPSPTTDGAFSSDIQPAFRAVAAVPTPAPLPTGSNMMLGELSKVYSRVDQSLRAQDFPAGKSVSWETDVSYNDTLIRSVAFSIAAVEIQQRGLGPQQGGAPGKWLDPTWMLNTNVSETTMTYLKVLAETAQTYITIGALRSGGENAVSSHFMAEAEKQHKQLFIREYPEARDDMTILPVLSVDGFVLLTDYAYCLSEIQGVEIAHLIRLCYLIEIVRAVHHIRSSIPSERWMELVYSEILDETPEGVDQFSQFCEHLMQMTFDSQFKPNAVDTADAETTKQNAGFAGVTLEDVYEMVKRYALIFLRKTMLLMHVKFGVNFSEFTALDHNSDELTRLTEALLVPDFDNMLGAILPHAESIGWNPQVYSLVASWVEHQVMYTPPFVPEEPLGMVRLGTKNVPMGLAHPGIVELIGLPEQFDLLIEEATRRKCPTSGKDILDAALCLACGEIFCGQSTCCLKSIPNAGSIGGAQQHMFKCQRTTGMFLNIRKCSIFYLFRRSGSFSQAPYLDRYGEADMGLRHGRQLTLNKERYDKLRHTFLTQGIPSFVGRKLEAEVNNGGWETM